MVIWKNKNKTEFQKKKGFFLNVDKSSLRDTKNQLFSLAIEKTVQGEKIYKNFLFKKKKNRSRTSKAFKKWISKDVFQY